MAEWKMSIHTLSNGELFIRHYKETAVYTLAIGIDELADHPCVFYIIERKRKLRYEAEDKLVAEEKAIEGAIKSMNIEEAKAYCDTMLAMLGRKDEV